MTSYDIRPLQLRILDILLAVDKVCKEHNLRYYLWAGTMLGAIRHKGFIPWDDDMDIAMPRNDYDMLMQHSKEWLPGPFEAKCAEIDHSYSGAFGKVIDSSTTLIEREHYSYLAGIYIDVFPLDGMPESRVLQYCQMTKYKILCKLIYFYHRDPYKHGHGFDSWIPLLVRRIFSHDLLQRKVRNVMTKYGYEDSKYVIDYDDKSLHGLMNKNVINPPTPIIFEGKKLQGVSQPDIYLTKKYGNYMQIPDVEHQRQHSFFYLDYNTPYRKYNDFRSFLNNK